MLSILIFRGMSVSLLAPGHMSLLVDSDHVILLLILLPRRSRFVTRVTLLLVNLSRLLLMKLLVLRSLALPQSLRIGQIIGQLHLRILIPTADHPWSGLFFVPSPSLALFGKTSRLVVAAVLGKVAAKASLREARARHTTLARQAILLAEMLLRRGDPVDPVVLLRRFACLEGFSFHRSCNS